MSNTYDARFQTSFITEEMEQFQYDHQCCGWEGPEDYSIPYPQGCCGRRKSSSKHKICADPYPTGCRLDYLDRQNKLEAWRMIGDSIRLIFLISIFLIFTIIYAGEVKKRREISARRKESENALLSSNENECDIEKCGMEIIPQNSNQIQRDADLEINNQVRGFENEVSVSPKINDNEYSENEGHISRTSSQLENNIETSPAIPTLKSIETIETKHSILPTNEETLHINHDDTEEAAVGASNLTNEYSNEFKSISSFTNENMQHQSNFENENLSNQPSDDSADIAAPVKKGES